MGAAAGAAGGVIGSGVVLLAVSDADHVGNLAEWAAALFAAAAFVAAYQLLNKEQAELRTLQEEVAERRAEQRAGQANLVSAWVDSDDGVAPAGSVEYRTPMFENTEWHSVLVKVRNGSDLPIYRLQVLVRPFFDDFPLQALHAGTSGQFWAVLPPQALEHERLDVEKLTELLTAPPVEITFTDAGGRHWHRNVDGKLKEITDNPGGVC